MTVRIRSLLCVVCALVLTACATPDVRLTISADAVLNRDDGSDSLPVLVRLYQLSSSHAIERAGFETLWKDDLGVLGGDLLMREEIIVEPASQQAVEMPRHRRATHIAAVAIFRQPNDSGWKDLTGLSRNFLVRRFDRRAMVILKGNTISISR